MEPHPPVYISQRVAGRRTNCGEKTGKEVQKRMLQDPFPEADLTLRQLQ
jgi:hypothetical protein